MQYAISRDGDVTEWGTKMLLSPLHGFLFHIPVEFGSLRTDKKNRVVILRLSLQKFLFFCGKTFSVYRNSYQPLTSKTGQGQEWMRTVSLAHYFHSFTQRRTQTGQTHPGCEQKMCDADDTVWTVPVMCNKSHCPLPPVSSPYFHFTDVQADCDQVHNARARSPRGRIYHYCGWTERNSNKSEELNWTAAAGDSHCLLIGIASFFRPLDSSAVQGRINSQRVQKWYRFNNAEDDLLKVFTWPFKVAPWDIVSSLAATVFAEQTEMRKWAINHRCFVDNLKWWM